MKVESGLLLNGRYRLVSQLAMGGMGEIWRAWDQEEQRVVAIKMLKEELAGQESFLARLRAEAQNTRQLTHPNLAMVYDYGEKDGLGWMVMELVDGRPLSQLLKGGSVLSIETLLPILIQISRALSAAHLQGVVHRDVKPGNILVSASGVAKLTDFGISVAPQRIPLTAVGMVMGTAQYLPPEQAMGDPATPLGDIYALGIIAYEGLAGHRPFTGPTQIDIALAHVKDPVPPLPETVPPAMSTLVMQMLEKTPEKRPSSAIEVSKRLEEVLAEVAPHIHIAPVPQGRTTPALAGPYSANQATAALPLGRHPLPPTLKPEPLPVPAPAPHPSTQAFQRGTASETGGGTKDAPAPPPKDSDVKHVNRRSASHRKKPNLIPQIVLGIITALIIAGLILGLVLSLRNSASVSTLVSDAVVAGVNNPFLTDTIEFEGWSQWLI
ncbi:MAG: protein kinase [Actinomycetaceae bacterium]|nr:protein kinase [Actinomycetaceae bacterium]